MASDLPEEIQNLLNQLNTRLEPVIYKVVPQNDNLSRVPELEGQTVWCIYRDGKVVLKSTGHTIRFFLRGVFEGSCAAVRRW